MIIPEIHQFMKGNREFILNIKNGQYFIVDDIIYHFLNLYEKHRNLQIVEEKLEKKYSKRQIGEALEELSEIFKQNDKDLEYPDTNSFKNDELEIDSLVLMISQDCNLRCEYCYGDTGKNRSNRLLMDNTIAETAIDFLVDNCKSPNVAISFFGGEPLINYEVIRRIVAYANDKCRVSSKKVGFSITTNGTLLTSLVIDFLRKNNFRIILSLDGPKHVHDKMRYFPNKKGSYDLIVQNVKEIPKRYKESISIRTTLTKKYTKKMNLVSHFQKMGFFDIAIVPATTLNRNLKITYKSVGNIREEHKKLAFCYYNSLRRKMDILDVETKKILKNIHNPRRNLHPCDAGINTLAVSATGVLYICHRLVGNDKYRVGHINNKRIKNKLIEKIIRKTVDKKNICSTCWARYYCGGGCYHESEIHFGRFDMSNSNYQCEIFKDWLEWMFWLYARVKQEGLISELEKERGKDNEGVQKLSQNC